MSRTTSSWEPIIKFFRCLIMYLSSSKQSKNLKVKLHRAKFIYIETEFRSNYLFDESFHPKTIPHFSETDIYQNLYVTPVPISQGSNFTSPVMAVSTFSIGSLL